MVTHPYWINAQLAIVPRPRGGDWLEDEMMALKEAGIEVLVSMLEGTEAAELLLLEEASSAQQQGIIFINFAITDRGVPSDVGAFESFLSTVEDYLSTGKRVGVHCRACVGRASVTTVSILIRSGIAASCAWQQVADARKCHVPDTEQQREWVNNAIKPKVSQCLSFKAGPPKSSRIRR